MSKFFPEYKTIVIYCLVITLFLVIPLIGNHAVTAFSESMQPMNTIVIDAGHGGVDCGAVSCTGEYESHINLQIALKLRDLLHLFGLQTVMIRDSDRSIDTEGSTIATKKVSDIKERIRITNATPSALLVSIHQNSFQDSRYSGTQVFYNNMPESKILADKLQTAFRETLNPANQRQTKKISGVYLMEHINCSGILIKPLYMS